ncbi:TPA: tail fiber protein [Pseudomonas aeruginosa]|nr:tail fiber protein [Pseudomonas aeruginosa]
MTNALAGKQPLDATLTALAALATAADKLIYSTGSDQFATSTLTAKARALLASVDESAMRTFLQLVKQTSVIDTTTGAMLSVGSFGIGKSVDLRQTIYVTGTPADLFGKGFAIGFADGGERGLAIPGLAGYIYGTLTVSVPYSDGSGRPSYHREFKTGGRTFTQYAANDVAWSAWVETWHSGNLTPADLPPPGAVVHFARNSAPSGWIKANGAAVSRTSYAALYAAIGTTFGAGDGSTTFNLPDLRGEFLRGWDDGRGVDSGRAFASAQGDQLQEHNHGGSGQLGNVAGGSGEYVFNGVNGAATPIGSNYTPVNGNVGNFGAETRPRNIALLACIKY